MSSVSSTSGDACDWYVTFTGVPGNQEQVCIYPQQRFVCAAVVDCKGSAASIAFRDTHILCTILRMSSGIRGSLSSAVDAKPSAEVQGLQHRALLLPVV